MTRNPVDESAVFDEARRLLEPDALSEQEMSRLLEPVGFSDPRLAHRRLLEICRDPACRDALGRCLPMLLVALSHAATPDGSLVNFERFVQSVEDRVALFGYLASNPRAVEILVKLFVGSQFLTQILLRNPDYLERLTNHKRLADFKSRQQFFEEAQGAADGETTIAGRLDALRRYQRWELLRIGACDSFGLFDLKSVTVQLSLLADGLVQSCLALLAHEFNVDTERTARVQSRPVSGRSGATRGGSLATRPGSLAGFAVLALGKLGGEELNYSSDIDLVFLAEKDAARFWPLGQRLIKALMESTGEGFLYRVDMRLRPWGRSGALVNTVEAHCKYLKQHGMPWEKQALLKARVIAGEAAVGEDFIRRAEPLVYGMAGEEVRKNIREMKERIESDLSRQGRPWGQVKAGAGSIRDIEFVTQCLQLLHGGSHPAVRSINTLDGLVRLADFGFLQADEFRQLSSGYVFLRTIEHALQLMHHKQIHALPEDRREMEYLARRLDYPDAERFLRQYQQHCEAIREIYDKYVVRGASHGETKGPVPPGAEHLGSHSPVPHLAQMEPSYRETFSEAAIAHHAELLAKLSDENPVELEAVPLEDGRWELTIVGYDHPGDLSRICGLLFVYGFNIADGNVFTAIQREGKAVVQPGASAVGPRKSAARRFINTFTLHPPLELVLPEVWERYKRDLIELLQLVGAGQQREAQGRLAKRVAGALRPQPEPETTLYPVDVRIDNESSERMTVLHIRGEDTIGFLYELTNALALAGIYIVRVAVTSVGKRVHDTLYVTDAGEQKITDPGRQQELRAAVVLIKHFTHLLPHSPNPEAALLHFRDFVEHLFRQPNWLEEFASLERPDVLDALARLLGASNFLWEDFLRLQHANLFPVLTDVEALAERKTKQALQDELSSQLSSDADLDRRRELLNAFKDREMFRTDMRHILGHVTEFGQFSAELTDVAEVVVEGACRICREQLETRYGQPLLGEPDASASPGEPDASASPGEPDASASGSTPAGSRLRLAESRLCVAALGKCGGRELGYASDIELMFIYEADGKTTGPEVITCSEYFQKLVEAFRQTIRSRQEGIFQIDLRLRPYGRAGPSAVALDAFGSYFGPEGAAWPYERQALVKLRPIAGDKEFGRQVVRLRDALIYTGEPFDVSAMRAMREKQVRQLVKAGTLNAKLSPGGLVDCEYLVQGLQITHGHRDPALRATNTLEAMAALRETGILSADHYRQLQGAYILQRRLIDAMRVVRGHAKDLSVPPPETEEFEFLARRLGYGSDTRRLQAEMERCFENVGELNQLLE